MNNARVMETKLKKRVAMWLAVTGMPVLLFLHLDFWRAQRETLLFGWLPGELLYRIVFVLLAWLYMLFVCATLWPDEADE